MLNPVAVLDAWRSFVGLCESGYDDNIYEYENDLAIRDLIEKLLTDDRLAALPESHWFGAEAARFDDLFRALRPCRASGCDQALVAPESRDTPAPNRPRTSAARTAALSPSSTNRRMGIVRVLPRRGRAVVRCELGVGNATKFRGCRVEQNRHQEPEKFHATHPMRLTAGPAGRLMRGREQSRWLARVGRMGPPGGARMGRWVY